MYQCSNNILPTIEEVRAWAYNEDLLFTEQDEDLILYARQYVQILMELVSEPECPKGDYCFSILTSYCQDVMARRRLKDIEEIAALVTDTAVTLTIELNRWRINLLKFAALASCPRSLDDAEVHELGFFLLVGPSKVLNFELISRSTPDFFQFSASSDSYRQYCHIDSKTGFWEVGKSMF